MSANVAALAPLHRVMGTHATDYRLGCGASGVRAYGCLSSARAEHDRALREIAGVPESEEAAR